MVIIYYVLGLLVYSLVADALSYSKGGARARFEQKFENTCMKYPFVHQYIDTIRNPRSEYLIFVFHEAGQKIHGGLGDRVAGVISALAYAMRTGRTFLMQGDAAFEQAFRPYFPYNKQDSVGSEKKYTWSTWDWANWSPYYSANMTKLHCINPRPGEKHCALDIDYYSKFKVIKYYGNRAYLCRWIVKPSLGIKEEVAMSLNLTLDSDLYEAAGCMLRLAMWPTELLWSALDKSLAEQFAHRASSTPVAATPATPTSRLQQGLQPNSNGNGDGNGDGEAKDFLHTTQQVGFHFRCGDSSFAPATPGQPRVPNPQCYVDPTGAVPWKGTEFSDDRSVDSPLEAATCGKALLLQTQRDASIAQKPAHSPTQSTVLAYIASDNVDSAMQINSTLGWDFTIRPPEACHMDLQKNLHCTLTTSLHWFMLSLSDAIVMQALIKPEQSAYFNSPETAHMVDTEAAPISAFSRYAAIYSLSPNVIRYGHGCRTANTHALSFQTHGNWVCDPRQFY
jgi:hypothetical protein